MSVSPRRAAIVCSRVRIEERMLLGAFERRNVRCERGDDRAIALCVGETLPWDLVLNRSISATTRAEVSRICHAGGVPVVSRLEVLQQCDNKIAMSLALHAAGVPIPRTVLTLAPEASLRAVDRIGYPAVMKSVNGSWGRGLARLTDRHAAEAVLSTRAQLCSPMQRLGYMQEFVHGRDLRVLVIGGAPVAAISRESDHWVRNTARDAVPCPVALTHELCQVAQRAATAVGGGVLGVDLLETPDGKLVVLEVNGTPEFHGLAHAHPHLDIAEAVVGYVLDEVAV